jgi:hypothetical protein
LKHEPPRWGGSVTLKLSEVDGVWYRHGVWRSYNLSHNIAPAAKGLRFLWSVSARLEAWLRYGRLCRGWRRCPEMENGPTPLGRMSRFRQPGRATLNSTWRASMKAEPPEKIQKATNPSTRGHWNEMNRKQRREVMRQIQSEDISLEVVHPDAAGIDIGNESHYVAVPPSRDNQPVRCFACTTAELKAMADWLKRCGVRTVAMQSTGLYWIAVYDILEQAGLEVYLVNARETKNLPGRKSDVQESQWLMKLPTRSSSALGTASLCRWTAAIAHAATKTPPSRSTT